MRLPVIAKLIFGAGVLAGAASYAIAEGTVKFVARKIRAARDEEKK